MPNTDSAVKTLYLPSTPLNVLVSCALAIQNAEASSKKTMAELWLIDQKNTHRNPYVIELAIITVSKCFDFFSSG